MDRNSGAMMMAADQQEQAYRDRTVPERGNKLHGPTIETNIANLLSNAEMLVKRMNELRERLIPVMHPTGPAPDKQGREYPTELVRAQSPVSERLGGAHGLINEARAIVDDIESRLHL